MLLSKCFEDPYYPGQLAEAYTDIISDPLDIDDDEDISNFSVRLSQYLLKSTEILINLVEKGKHEVAAQELKTLEDELLRINQRFIIEIITRADDAEDGDKNLIELPKFLLNGSKEIFKTLLDSVFNEITNRNLEKSFLDYFYKLYLSGKQDLKRDKEKLSLKQQIILLEKIGFFELPLVNSLTKEKKGKLVSSLLGSSEKNTLEYIRNLNVPKNSVSKDILFVKTEENLETVKRIMIEAGLEKL